MKDDTDLATRLVARGAGLLDVLLAIRTGRLSADDYVRSCRARAATLEPWLRAFSYLPPHHEASGTGTLTVPVGIKDLIDTSDMPTTYGSPIYNDHVPAADAWVVDRLRGLGAVIFGKTVTTEFAFRSPGPTVNPWNRAHSPGGSSSGSAAAVAAGVVPLALGTQTLGSIIRPAAFNGVVGLKPSFGAIPRTGVHPLAASLDHVGFFARAVDDVAYALSLLIAMHESDPHGRAPPPFSVDVTSGLEPLMKPRLAFVRTGAWDRTAPIQREIMAHAISALCAAGADVVDLTLPPGYERIPDAIETVLVSEAAPAFRNLVDRYPDRTSQHLKDLVGRGAAASAPDYVSALSLQAELRHRFSGDLNDFDAVVTAPATGEAPKGLDWTGDYAFCIPWTFLGVPAVTLPIGFGPNGLPLGLQIVGRYREDLRMLRVAKFAERALARTVRIAG